MFIVSLIKFVYIFPHWCSRFYIKHLNINFGEISGIKATFKPLQLHKRIPPLCYFYPNPNTINHFQSFFVIILETDFLHQLHPDLSISVFFANVNIVRLWLNFLPWDWCWPGLCVSLWRTICDLTQVCANMNKDAAFTRKTLKTGNQLMCCCFSSFIFVPLIHFQVPFCI